MDRFTLLFGARRGRVHDEPETLTWSVVFPVSRQLSDDAAAQAARHWEQDGSWWVELNGCIPADADAGQLRAQLQRRARMWCAATGVKATRTPQVRLG